MNYSNYMKKTARERLEIENGFGGRKSGTATDYNFDIEEMIRDFSFYDLIYKTQDDQGENGAFIVITDKQYVIGYNASHGIGSHQQSFAKCMAEFEGGKRVGGFQDSVYYSTRCEELFLTAKIVFRFAGMNENYQPTYDGKIIFILGNQKITPEKMQVFEKFYNDHNREITGVCRRYPFDVCFSYYDEKGERHSSYTKSLDELLEVLRSKVSYDAPQTSSDDEQIIGVPLEKAKQKIR